MFNLAMKDLKLGVNPLFLVLPLLMGALTLVPGWIYFIVPMYFFWITVPAVFANLRANNDLLFTAMMPVAKRDMVKARVAVIVFLELLHLGIALILGIVNTQIYPNMEYYFFAPTIGFWGLAFVMMALFNLVFIPMYYKTGYKHGAATSWGIAIAMLFALAAQWIGIENTSVANVVNDIGTGHLGAQAIILVAGIAIYAAVTAAAFQIGLKRFLKVEIQ